MVLGYKANQHKYFLLVTFLIVPAFFCLFVDAATLENSTSPVPKEAPNKFKKTNRFPDVSSNKILVKFKLNTPADEINSAIDDIGAEKIKYFDRIRVFYLKLGKNVSVDKAIKTLQKNPAVEYAEPEQTYQTNNF